MDPNIILIVCDTLRKDVLGLYGGEAKTPFLKALSKDAMVYDNAIAPSPWTFPSHVSMFTGMYPSEHGVHESRTDKLEQMTDMHHRLKAKRLAERLKKQGYNTIGISNNVMVSRFTGFDIGFDTFFNTEPSPWIQSRLSVEARQLGSNAFQITKALLAQGKLTAGMMYKYMSEFVRLKSLAKALNYPLDKGARLTNTILDYSALREKFFLFINFWDAHEPYSGFSEKRMLDNFAGIRKTSDAEARAMKRQYILEAEYLDSQLGALVGMLKRRNLYDDSLILITSDHGQAFNEHGYMYHDVYLYDELVRIPMIVKYPHSKKFKRAPGYQSLVSVPALIQSVVDGGDDSALTTNVAFSEAYGNSTGMPQSYRHRMDYVAKKYEKVRKAMYKDGYKLTVNDTDGIVEEFSKGSKRIDTKADYDKHAFKEMAKEIRDFGKKEGFGSRTVRGLE